MLLSNPATASTRIDRALRAYTTRRLPAEAFHAIDTNPRSSPLVDDVILARVTRVGSHRQLESVHGRASDLSPGDEIIVAIGAGDAPERFDATVPTSFGPCHLAAGGGTAATLTSRRHDAEAPTELAPIGFLLDARARRVNLARYGLPRSRSPGARPVTLLSVPAGCGAGMGRTTLAAHLIHGLTQAGKRVGAAKITGTGSGSDLRAWHDAGALEVLDFVDAGHSSTSGLSADALCRIVETVQDQIAASGVDVMVIEVADGVRGRETELLLRSPFFGGRVDGALLSSNDPVCAIAGARSLKQFGVPVLGLSGQLTESSARALEAAAGTGVRAWPSHELRCASTAASLFDRAAASRRERALA